MNAPKVSVVILNYNTAGLIKQLIPFVMKTTYSNFELVVADNASTDNSVEVIKSFANQGVKYLQLDQNYGFAGGYNKALEQINSDYYILLNSDVEVDPEWIEPLVDLALSNPDITAVQPKILDYYNRDKYEYAGASGGFIDKWAYPFCRGRLFDTLEKDEGQYDDNKEIFWASGAALFIKSEDYHKAGGLDTDFFAHMEEIDLCWRLKNMGRQIWVCPESKVYHMGGGTLSKQNSRKTFLNFRNNLALITKNVPQKQRARLLLIRLVLDGVAGLKFLFSFQASHCLAIIRAHFNYYGSRKKWIEKSNYSHNKAFLTHIGVYKASLIRQYFLKKKTKYSEL